MPLSDHPSLISGTYLLLLLQLQLLRKQTFTPKPNFFYKIEKFYQKKSWGVSFLAFLDILHRKPPSGDGVAADHQEVVVGVLVGPLLCEGGGHVDRDVGDPAVFRGVSGQGSVPQTVQYSYSIV